MLIARRQEVTVPRAKRGLRVGNIASERIVILSERLELLW
eukprot:COSAG02_NODE_32617_length_513_cov_1.014493_1_plen_39_part_01